MDGSLFIVVVWVAGTRMIAQGSDGLSRGDFFNGVLAGKDFLSFIPLDKGALELSEGLLLGVANEYFPAREELEPHLDPAACHRRRSVR
jgi:hypothetical protein